MKVLSLFDGISCARVALDRAGIEVESYYASEIDKYAIYVARKNSPYTMHVGSVKDLEFKAINNPYRHVAYSTDGKNIIHDSHIDLLIGGSPCQDLSIAKANREGLEGEKSNLFWEYVRILKEVKPKWFILENVASMSNEAKAIITKEMGVEPIMINASLVSAQNRKRLFWTNIPNVTLPKDKGIVLKDIVEWDAEEKYFLNKDFALTPSTNPDIAGTLDTGTWAKRYEQIRRVYNLNNKAPTLPTGTGGGVITKIAIPVAMRNRGLGKQPEFNGTEKANSMTTVQTDSMVAIVDDLFRIRKLTPTECERLQGLPDGYTEGISNTQRYKCLGNAFNADVVAHILSFIPKQ